MLTSSRWWLSLHLALLVPLGSCQQSADSSRGSADLGGAAAASIPEEPPAVVPSGEDVDTLPVQIGVVDPTCVPGACVCRGSAERAAGLWRVGLETTELATGVHCVGADFDGNGSADLVLLGSEGLLAAVMFDARKARSLHELDAGGFPALYEPRDVPGPNGEPAARTYGILVPDVGQNHAVFLREGEAFVRTLYPSS